MAKGINNLGRHPGIEATNKSCTADHLQLLKSTLGKQKKPAPHPLKQGVIDRNERLFSSFFSEKSGKNAVPDFLQSLHQQSLNLRERVAFTFSVRYLLYELKREPKEKQKKLLEKLYGAIHKHPDSQFSWEMFYRLKTSLQSQNFDQDIVDSMLESETGTITYPDITKGKDDVYTEKQLFSFYQIGKKITKSTSIKDRNSEISFYVFNSFTKVGYDYITTVGSTKEQSYSKFFPPFPERYTLNFESLQQNLNPKGIAQFLEEYYNAYGEKGLYKISGIITLIRTLYPRLQTEDIKEGLEIFLQKNLKYRDFLTPASRLSTEKPHILKKRLYWMFRNIFQVFALGSMLQKQGIEKPKIGGFSSGGSYGAIYLGQLYRKYENTELPDIFLGASAGNLYPILFYLWKQALETNPKGLQKIVGKSIKVDSLESLLSFAPKGLRAQDSMIKESNGGNGSKIMSAFLRSFQELLQVQGHTNINLDEATFKELGLPMGAIATHLRTRNTAVLSQDDPVVQSSIVSANPYISMGGGNILTDNNTLYGLAWNDGFHSDKNGLSSPVSLGLLLGVPGENLTSFYSYPNADYSDRAIKKVGGEHRKPLGDYGGRLFGGSYQRTQSIGFDQDNAKFLAILGYKGKLSLDLLSDIHASSISSDRKKYFVEKLINLFLRLDDTIALPKTRKELISLFEMWGIHGILGKKKLINKVYKQVLKELYAFQVKSGEGKCHIPQSHVDLIRFLISIPELDNQKKERLQKYLSGIYK